MIEPHSAQLGASAWAENATLGPPSEAAIPARPLPARLPLPFEAPDLLVAMTARSSFATGIGLDVATRVAAAMGAEVALAVSPVAEAADDGEPDEADDGDEAPPAFGVVASAADAPSPGPGANVVPADGEGTRPAIASDWAVIPSSARGLSALAPNAAGASATTCDRSTSPRAARSSTG